LPQTLECPHDGFQRTGDGDLEFFMKSLSCFQPKTECEWQLDRAGSHKSRPGNPSPPRWKRNELRCRPAGIRLRHSPSLHPSSRYLRCRRRKGRRGYLRKDFGGSFTALFGLVPAKPVPPLPTRSCFLGWHSKAYRRYRFRAISGAPPNREGKRQKGSCPVGFAIEAKIRLNLDTLNSATYASKDFASSQ
jgi:hypothetical protein